MLKSLKDLTSKELRLSRYAFAEIRDSALERGSLGMAELYNELAGLIGEEMTDRKEKLKSIQAELYDVDPADIEWTAEAK